MREQAEERFPERIIAFQPEMRVHGKFKAACMVSDTPIQRTQYSDLDCPDCHTGGRIFSDQSLARLLKDDCPKTLDELES